MPTFWDYLLVPSACATCALKMGSIGSPKTSVSNNLMPHNNLQTEEFKPSSDLDISSFEDTVVCGVFEYIHMCMCVHTLQKNIPEQYKRCCLSFTCGESWSTNSSCWQFQEVVL